VNKVICRKASSPQERSMTINRILSIYTSFAPYFDIQRKGGGLMRESKPWSKTKNRMKYPLSSDIQVCETQRKVFKLPEINEPLNWRVTKGRCFG